MCYEMIARRQPHPGRDVHWKRFVYSMTLATLGQTEIRFELSRFDYIVESTKARSCGDDELS